MKVTIWSHWQGQTWTGEVPIPEASTDDQLEHIFRWFNRVEDGDDDRLTEAGYLLPSLSVGDLVTLPSGERWQVAPMGFVTADD